ncbi:MAG: 2-C-methyl-D-erythritol 2,4-cyclodiphosphate synthase [Dysgonamonadaceae bacterium]|jgi:2-C-methyl-D-erythritol 2,4-cyclodiphosphate synthase|nr:2-C-methyl-D-erythritol 2,4-cyclodiphosphate synthase [Dysgonamonadaceae bacterium]
MSRFRVGFGYDVHRFARDRALYLGGIEISHRQGLLGHSDADVVIHALCDALLGAAALCDIGCNFPDNDKSFEDIDSKILLKKTMQLLADKGYSFGNADITVCAEQPKLNPHIPQMQTCLAEIMNVSPDDISIKATTNESMGFVGREEGIAAYCTVLII